MKIAVTSQNRKTITGHAGKCRKFWVYETEDRVVQGRNLLELPLEQSFHESHGNAPHPLDDVDVLICGGMGFGLQQRLKQKGIYAVATSETDPDRAVAAWLEGTLAEAAPEEHDHDHPRLHPHPRPQEASQMSAERIYIYKRYERFWHWSQAVLIIVMMLTGFEVHGSYALLGFKTAVQAHTFAAWALLTLWAFTIFWQFTTGEWRQYLPTLKNVDAMIRYYVIGIFKDVPHPFRKTVVKKHNPLQRLAYLALLAFISPILWGSGLLYLFYVQWPLLGLERWLSLEGVAFAHTLGAYLITAFFFIHVYLTTTGHTVFAHIKAMITGWEEIHDAEQSGKSH